MEGALLYFPHSSQSVQVIAVIKLNVSMNFKLHYEKGNTRLIKLFGGLSNENSGTKTHPLYMMAR